MNFLSVCSGIDAASVALIPDGWTPIGFAEIEPFPCAVLRHHHPDVPNHGDFTTIDPAACIGADALIGGTPCQAFSVAGLRGSLADARGNLSLAFVRLANAIDDLRRDAGLPPLWVWWENVPGVLNTADNAFGHFLGGLCGNDAALDAPSECGWPDAGVVAGPARVVAWRVLDAQFFGLAQRRRRVFVLALGGPGRWDAADALLPVTKGGGGDCPSRGKARKRTAGTLAARTSGGGGLGTDFDLDGGVVVGTITAKWAKHGGGPSGDECQNLTLCGPVAFDTTQISHPANRSNPQPGDPCHGLAKGAHAPAIALSVAIRGRDGGGTAELGGEIANALRTGGGGGDKAHALTGAVVRRLTPRECERLQGFPDDYTAIPWRGSAAADCPDGPRYRALGNSMAVPVMRWIGQRISEVAK